MRTFHMRHSAIAVGLALLSSCNQPIALARGSQIVRDDPWNSERIEFLPPEVRNASSACVKIMHRAPVATLRPTSTVRA
jgi:hypothetical protein